MARQLALRDKSRPGPIVAAFAATVGLGFFFIPQQSISAQGNDLVGLYLENFQERIFFPCGTKMSDDGLWVRFADGVKADSIRYRYAGAGFPAVRHDVRLKGHLSPPQRPDSAIRFGTGFHTRELEVDEVVQVGDPGSLCAGSRTGPDVYQGAGSLATRFIDAVPTDDRTMLATIELNGDVSIWRAGDGMLLRRFPSGHAFHESAGATPVLSFNRAGTLLAEAGQDGYVRVWSVPKGELRWKLAHSVDAFTYRDARGQKTGTFGAGAVAQIAFSSSGVVLASVGAGRGYLWSMKTGALMDTLRDAGERRILRPNQVVSASKPMRFVASSREGLLVPYLTSDGWPLFAARVQPESIAQIAISPDSRFLAIQFEFSDSVAVWSIPDGRVAHWLVVPFYPGTMVFSPDSRRIAISTSTGAIFFWDVVSGQPVHSIHGLEGWPRRMWFNATGDSMIVAPSFTRDLYIVPTGLTPFGRFLSQ